MATDVMPRAALRAHRAAQGDVLVDTLLTPSPLPSAADDARYSESVVRFETKPSHCPWPDWVNSDGTVIIPNRSVRMPRFPHRYEGLATVVFVEDKS